MTDLITVKIKNIICDIMSLKDLSNLENISLFEMGADSITALSILDKVNQEYGSSFDIKFVLNNSDSISNFIKSMAETLVKSSPEATTETAEKKVIGQATKNTDFDSFRSMVKAQMAAFSKLCQMQLDNFPHSEVSFNRSKTDPLMSTSFKNPSRSIMVPSAQQVHWNGMPELSEEFIKSYRDKTGGSRLWADKARTNLCDNRISAGYRESIRRIHYPIVAAEGEGAWIKDVDGNSYLDLAMGFGVHLFGHNVQWLINAQKQAFESGIFLGPLIDAPAQAAAEVSKITNQERVCFVNTGTEAVMTAIRLARAYTARNKIAVLSGSYHGHGDSTLIYGAGAEVHPICAGIPQESIEHMMVLPVYVAELKSALEQIKSPPAAILVEPVQSRNPLHPKVEVLALLRQYCNETGTLLIFDEMITGFRFGGGGVQQRYGVKADITTYGKIIGGGFPVGLIAGKASIMKLLDGGVWVQDSGEGPSMPEVFFAGTFCKHPVMLKGMMAVCDWFKKNQALEIDKMESQLWDVTNELNRCFQRFSVPMEVHQRGSLFRFMHQVNLDSFYYHMLYRGVYFWEGRTCFWSTIHTAHESEYLIKTVRDVMAELFPVKPVAKSMGLRSSAIEHGWKACSQSKLVNQSCTLRQQVKIEGVLDKSRLKQAWKLLSNRYEHLRRALLEDGSLNVCDPIEVEIHEDTRKSFQDWREEQKQKILNFGDPLFTCSVFIGEETTFISLLCHHLLIDGHGLGLLFLDFISIYEGKLLEEISGKIEYLSDEILTDSEQSFWLNEASAHFRRKEEIPSPSYEKRPVHGSRKIISGGKLLKNMAAASNCTPYLYFLYLAAELFREWGGVARLWVGVVKRPLSGRNLTNPTHCTKVVPMDVPEDIHTIERLKEKYFAWSQAPAVNVAFLNTLCDEGDACETPHLTVNLETYSREFMIDGFKIEEIPQPSSYCRSNLVLHGRIEGEDLNIFVEGREDIYTENWVQSFLKQFEWILMGEPVKISQYFYSTWEKAANRIAVTDGDFKLSYKELLQVIKKRKLLREQGVVALDLRRSVSLVEWLCTCLLKERPYLILDPLWPPFKKEKILKECNAVELISDAEHTVLATDYESFADGVPYLIATSGTTGEPKIIAGSNTGLLTYIESLNKKAELGDRKTYLWVSNPCADLSYTALYGALGSGGTLLLMPHEFSYDPMLFREFVKKHSYDVLKITPTHFRSIRNASEQELIYPKETLVFGGEPLSSALVKEIKHKREFLRVQNHYGPAECSVAVLYSECKGEADNYDLTSLNHLNEAALLQVSGDELYIGGPCVGRGQIKKGVLSSLDCEIICGIRFYKTGDLAGQNQGNFSIKGRKDRQLKISGNRIEAAEIEAAALSHPEVESARAELNSQGKITLQISGEIPEEVLKSYLRDKVPLWAVPQQIQQEKRIELASSGKAVLNRQSMDSRREKYCEIQEIAERILKREVNPEKSFLHYGDSLDVIRLVGEMNDAGYKVTAEQVRNAKTFYELEDISKKENILKEQKTESTLHPIHRWFVNLDIKNPNQFLLTCNLKFKTPLSQEIVKAAIEQLIQAHQSLKTLVDPDQNLLTFKPQAGYFWDTAAEWGNWPEDAEIRLENKFNFKKGPLAGAVARIDHGGDVIGLFLGIHHLAVDMISCLKILDDLDLCLSGREIKPTNFLNSIPTKKNENASMALSHAFNMLSESTWLRDWRARKSKEKLVLLIS